MLDRVAFRYAWRTSTALAITAALTAVLSFFFWRIFERDPPMTVGNMRGTALTVFALAVPIQVASMMLARRGSPRGVFVWLGCLAYLAYNAVMFCFAVRFNSLFLPCTAFLALAFWAPLTLLRSIDVSQLAANCQRVPARSVTAYLVLSALAFAWLWLSAIIPASIDNRMPEALAQSGFNQNPVWVLDFAFTFPLMTVGSIWLWRRLAWGYVVSGMMVIMLTLETAGIAVDQVFGHLHDPAAPLAAVPVMIAFTVVGLVFTVLFLRRVEVMSGKVPVNSPTT